MREPVSLEGTILQERFRVLDLLGEGGVAYVYRVESLAQKEEFAFKVLGLNGQRQRQRFLREAQSQQQLHHPHIVRVFEVIEEQGIVGFTMELCRGGDLKAHLRSQQGRLPLDEIERCFFPLLEGIALAHERGFVHRDIKPQNILLCPDPETQETIWKLSDFGLAKGPEYLEELTRTHAAMGTLGYMSPEQLNDSKRVDLRSDIYSLGVVLYHMLTGHSPYTGSALQLTAEIMTQPPRPPVEAPSACQPILLRCLAKDPAQRYSSCEALKHALQQAFVASTSPQTSISPQSAQPSQAQITSKATPKKSMAWRELTVDETEESVHPVVVERYKAASIAVAQPRSHEQPAFSDTPAPKASSSNLKSMGGGSRSFLWRRGALFGIVLLCFVGTVWWIRTSEKNEGNKGKGSAVKLSQVKGVELCRSAKTKYACRYWLIRNRNKRFHSLVNAQNAISHLHRWELPNADFFMRWLCRYGKGESERTLCRWQAQWVAERLRISKFFCEQGQADACSWVKDLKFSRRKPIDFQKRAFKRFVKLCELRDSWSCLRGARLLKRSPGLRSLFPSQSAPILWQKGCRLKNGSACFRLGEWYSARQQYKEAKRTWSKACQMQRSEACIALGQWYLSQKKRDEAKKLWLKACRDFYDQRACTWLKSHFNIVLRRRL